MHSQYLSVQLGIGVYFGVYGTVIVRRLRERQQQLADQRRRMEHGRTMSTRSRSRDSSLLTIRGTDAARSTHSGNSSHAEGIEAIQSRRQLRVLMRVRPPRRLCPRPCSQLQSAACR